MKPRGYLSVVLMAGLSVAGNMPCQAQSDYTGVGVVGGAAAGAIVGSTSRHPGSGALVGAAVGAVAGGLIGHALDQAQQQRLQAQAPQTWQRVDQGQPLAVADVRKRWPGRE